MVGTNPTEKPSACQPRATSRMNHGVATAIGTLLLAGAVLDLVAFALRRHRRSVRRIRMLGAWKRAVAHLLRIALRGKRDLPGQVGIALHELGQLSGGQAEHVVENEHLAIRARTGSDADRRDAQGPGDAGRDG